MSVCVLNIVLILWPCYVKSVPLFEGHSFNDSMYVMEEDPETIQELYSNETAVEGDMLLQSDRNAAQHIWLTHDIPYAIDEKLSSRTKDIEKATKMISDRSCLKFHQRTSEKDFIYFKRRSGCASYVGCIGGKQPIFMGDRCRVGNIVHEILHALGFYHEHTRMDRDEHVEILMENIRPGAVRNFKKKSGNTFDVPYDISSILHYGGKYFSSNGQNTIKPHDSTKPMGQRKRLTDSDVLRIQRLYSCDSST